jgi:signal transduction histidine kinase
MGILRNKEIKVFLALLLLFAAAGTALCFLLPLYAGYIAAAVFALYIALLLLFTIRRYGQIIKLNSYLKRINSGDYALDIRDNAEGELSILKSELYKVTVMLRERSELLLREKNKLSEALSDISHQLKTPLTSMLMMTDLLCDPSLPDDKRKEFTARMRAQLERLEWLVSSLLKLSRLDAKTVKFSPRFVPAAQLIEAAAAPVLIPAELKSQALSLDGGGVSIYCDEKWTAEALLNILKNCVEHTPENGVISVMCTDNPIYAEIRVEDSGPGISEADLPYIFKRFYRGKDAADDSVGIGLSMAAVIIQEQGGSIDAKNSSSGGSVFTIRFPK